jgi:hypothetical protein
VSPFFTFPHSKPQTTDSKISKICNPDNNKVPIKTRRKRRRLEVIYAVNDAEKDRQELLLLVRYALEHQCGAQTALNSFQYANGTQACRNLTVRQVEYAIKYVTITSYILFSLVFECKQLVGCI